jgi:Na+-transporting methylmalonyl-CoA/oxaloacetate decarboxylase gamma subunit
MNMILIFVILFIVLVGVALLGRRVRRYLPEEHLSADSKDAVKLAMGLVATMTALVLGLLINSAKGGYDTKRTEVIQMAAKVAFLNRVLALYGPEAVEARDELRAVVADAVQRMWPSERRQSAQLLPNEQLGDAFYAAIHRLSPHDDTQRALKTEAVTVMVDLGQLRLLLVAQSIPSISKPMLIILVSWLVVIFFGFSVVAPPNATTTLALVAAAFSVACAVFLILELDHPFGGVVRIPSEPMINVLNNLAK